MPASPSPRFLKATPAASKGPAPTLRLPAPQRWLALVRHNTLYWQTPCYGTRWEEVPAETQLLLWKNRDGSFGVALPLIDGDWRATARGVPGGIVFDCDGGCATMADTPITVACTARGKHPAALVRSAMAAAADRLKTFRLREDKPVPGFIDRLGWCTWDAFYHEVSQAKVRQGLRSLARAGINPGFLILDDGWLDVTGDLLNDFATHPKKFPRGLAATIRSAKEEFGIEYFGVWHAFEGYWAGVNPEGALSRRFRLLHTRSVIRPWDPREIALHWVAPDEIARFYQDFYRWLRGQGVDFTKTDGQSALEQFSGGSEHGRVSTMARYQEALQGAAMAHFATGPIHCMSNGSDVAFHFNASTLWRNSDDYFPRRPLENQQWHVQTNALNNLWTSTFAIPDWDMFQTHGPAPEFHAAARALSGGPVYICDKPGAHDAALIGKLVLSDGRVLRFPQPALPSDSVIFTDFRQEKRLLKIGNHAGRFGVLGLFHCTPEAVDIMDRFRAADVSALDRGDHAVYLHRAGTAHRLPSGASLQITLGQVEWEIATFSPLDDGWGVFGLLDKYNGPVAIEHWQVLGAREAVAVLRDGGRVGFHAPARPRQVKVNGRAAKFRYDPASKLLVVQAPVGGPVTVRLT